MSEKKKEIIDLVEKIIYCYELRTYASMQGKTFNILKKNIAKRNPAYGRH